MVHGFSGLMKPYGGRRSSAMSSGMRQYPKVRRGFVTHHNAKSLQKQCIRVGFERIIQQ